MSVQVNIAISSNFLAVLTEGVTLIHAMNISPHSKDVIHQVTTSFSEAAGVTSLTEKEAYAFQSWRILFTGMESTAQWWSVPLHTSEDASADLWAAATELVAVNDGGSDLSDALREMAMAFTAEPEKVVLTIEYEKPRPFGRQVKVAYDRSLHCAPILDASTGWTVSGVALFILFDQEFSVMNRDMKICSVPAGADEMNAQLKVSYAPDLGFSFHPASAELGWSIDEYHFIVDQPTGMSSMEPVDRSEFERFMAENAERFHPDPALQSGSYQLFVECELADEEAPTETTHPGESESTIMHTPELAPQETETSDFDFGTGTTSLDRHVAWLATNHHGYDYAKRIGTEHAWATAYDSYKSFRNVAGTSIMCKPRSLPEWLFEAVQEHAHRDSDTPAPSCFTATSTAIDWFALAKAHPEELALWVDFEPAPTLQHIEKALKAAQTHSADAQLWVTCEPPAEPGGAFTVSMGGLFITPQGGDTDLESIIERELGGVPAFIDSRQPETLEWAWMTQWPDNPAIQRSIKLGPTSGTGMVDFEAF